MNYCLRVLACGHPFKVEITAEQYSQLKSAKDTLNSFYHLTENYRIVVESYKAVERAKHEAELDYMLYADFSYIGAADSRVALNAPIIGYLSSSRYFLDSTDKILTGVLKDNQLSAYKTLRSKIYDTVPEYAFIEALRNYVQHRDLPTHTVTYHNFIEDQDNLDTSDIVVSLSLTATKDVLEKDKKWKRAASSGLGDRIDIVLCIRHHMEGLWRLHNYLLQKHSDLPVTARELLVKTIEEFRQQSPKSPLGLLHAISYEVEHEIVDKVPVFLDLDDARKDAIRCLGFLHNLHRRYVSGKNGASGFSVGLPIG